jgi:hypothetical protein
VSKVRLDKIARCLSVWGQKKTSWEKTAIFLSVWHLAILSNRTFDTQSIHIFGLVYYLSTSRNSPFYIRCYTYMENDLFQHRPMIDHRWQLPAKCIYWLINQIVFISRVWLTKVKIWIKLYHKFINKWLDNLEYKKMVGYGK